MIAQVSIIVPTLNEGAVIETLLNTLQPLRAAGHQLIVSDGGSADDTCERAKPLADQLVSGSPGRAVQMNRGAELAAGQYLWFVHADSGFEQPVSDYVERILRGGADWGRFDVRIDSRRLVFRLIAFLMNKRSCLSGIATGDQGIFVRRDLFMASGGYAPIALMEDVELSRRLKRARRPTCQRLRLITSARRWQRHGVWRTVLLMWRLRLAYFFGVAPEKLARRYRACSSPTHKS